jgi:hypothetical protein
MVNTDESCAHHTANEALLRSEIGFWRELIDSCADSEPHETVERMQHALALAETRLAGLFEDHQRSGRNRADRSGNVYRLIDRRSPRQ